MIKILSILLILVAVACSNQKKTDPSYTTLEGKITGVDLSSFNAGDTLVIDGNREGALRAKRPDETIREICIMGTVHKRVTRAPVIIDDSLKMTLDLWAYCHDKFLDFNDSIWKYMYNDLDKAETYIDSMLYYYEKQKEYKK